MKELRYVYDPYSKIEKIVLPPNHKYYTTDGFTRILTDSDNIPHIISMHSRNWEGCYEDGSTSSTYFMHLTKIDGSWRYESINAQHNSSLNDPYITWDVVIDTNDIISIIYYPQVGFSEDKLYRLYGQLYNWNYEEIGSNPFVIDGSTQEGKGLSAVSSGTNIYVVVTAMTSRTQNYGNNAVMYAEYNGSTWTINTDEYHVYGYCSGLQLEGGLPIFQTFRYYDGAPNYKPTITFMKKNNTFNWIEHLSYPNTVVDEPNYQYMMEFHNKTGRPFIVHSNGEIMTSCYEWISSTSSVLGGLLVYTEEGDFVRDPNWLVGQTFSYLIENLGSSYDYDLYLLKYRGYSNILSVYRIYFNSGESATIQDINLEVSGVYDACMCLDSSSKCHIAYWYENESPSGGSSSSTVILQKSKEGKYIGTW